MKWELTRAQDGEYFKCSSCDGKVNYSNHIDTFKFCPFCGEMSSLKDYKVHIKVSGETDTTVTAYDETEAMRRAKMYFDLNHDEFTKIDMIITKED